MKRAHKVFSKHTSKEVREWARQLMKSYQLLHAVEKPMNLDFVQPFANTVDLKEFVPKFDPNLAEHRRKEREEASKKTEKDEEVTIDMNEDKKSTTLENEEK